jgi:hypothetical protein
MNIFVLDMDMVKNAQYHCDKHIVKMPVESAQLLCSAFYFTDYIPNGIYKLTHANHPCSKWVRQSLSNWLWLHDMSLELCYEYTYRYGKVHKCELVIKSLPLPHIVDMGLTQQPQAMPMQYYNRDPVKAYRDYYNGEKQHLFSWKNRSIPEWIVM